VHRPNACAALSPLSEDKQRVVTVQMRRFFGLPASQTPNSDCLYLCKVKNITGRVPMGTVNTTKTNREPE
jgi:hypothetical protein